MIKINVTDKKIQNEYMKTNIGTPVTDDLRDNYIKSDIKKLFKKECFKMAVDILIGLQERSPLKYSILRNASAISSVNMVSKKEECVLKFQGLVDIMFRRKRLSVKSADNCKQQYDEFLEDVQFKHKENFLKFYLTDRIERGFSINKQILDNNLQEKSLISQRLIYYHFTSENIVLHEYVIPQALKKIVS